MEFKQLFLLKLYIFVVIMCLLLIVCLYLLFLSIREDFYSDINEEEQNTDTKKPKIKRHKWEPKHLKNNKNTEE